jgi:hypothetical protein
LSFFLQKKIEILSTMNQEPTEYCHHFGLAQYNDEGYVGSFMAGGSKLHGRIEKHTSRLILLKQKIESILSMEKNPQSLVYLLQPPGNTIFIVFQIIKMLSGNPLNGLMRRCMRLETSSALNSGLRNVSTTFSSLLDSTLFRKVSSRIKTVATYRLWLAKKWFSEFGGFYPLEASISRSCLKIRCLDVLVLGRLRPCKSFGVANSYLDRSTPK